MNWHTRLTQARTAKNLKKTELAKLVGVSPATVTLWESGKTKKIEGVNLLRVCDVLGIGPSWLLGEDDESDEALYWQNHALDPQGRELWQLQVLRFFADDTLQGYRVEPEYELDTRSLFTVRYQWLIANELAPDDVMVMRVRSLDMEPSISYGDILAVSRRIHAVEEGFVYVFAYEGSIIVRRVQRDAGEWWLTSDHPDQRRYARKLYRREDVNVKLIGKVMLRQTERI